MTAFRAKARPHGYPGWLIVLEGIDTVALCRISAHVRCLFRLQLQVR